MELRHLRYFVTIAEHENFHRAAEALHVSQSPLSRQMRDLEAEIGVRLFEPAGRGIRLTAPGRLFAEKARGVLAGVAAAVHEAQLAAQGHLGTVPIGFETGTAYFGTLSSIVSTFRRREPRVTVRLTPMSSAEQWAALRSGEIALGYGYYPPPDASIEHVEVSHDRLGIVVAAEHRLATRSRITVADLRDEPVLLQPRMLYPRLHDDIVAAVRAHDVTLNVTAEVADLEALLALVVSSDAVTFLPEKQQRILGLGAGVWRPVADLSVRVSDVVMWRRADAGAPLIRPLIDIVRETRAAS